VTKSRNSLGFPSKSTGMSAQAVINQRKPDDFPLGAVAGDRMLVDVT
jgi:hypothetical protein